MLLLATGARPTVSRMRWRLSNALGVGALLTTLVGCGPSITKGLTPTIPTNATTSIAPTAMQDCPATLSLRASRVAGPIRPPQFTSAVLCQYHGNPSQLLSSHAVQGTAVERLREAFRAARAWVLEPSCALPEPSNPIVLALFVQGDQQIGDALIYLSGCHVIESPYGTANADTSFQAELTAILNGGTD